MSFNQNTLSSEASDTKKFVIALLSDDAVIHAMHHLADNCLQFQLYPLVCSSCHCFGFLGKCPVGDDNLRHHYICSITIR